MDVRIVSNMEIYREVVPRIAVAERFIWIGTSDLKDMHVERNGRMAPLLEVLSDRIARQVSVRLIHAKEPGPAFRRDFDRYPNLIEGMERMLCPRVHFKIVVVDGTFAYMGSANVTGAGMGLKGPNRRNFEIGLATYDPAAIEPIMEQFDQVWMGVHCPDCRRKAYCSDFPDILKAQGR